MEEVLSIAALFALGSAPVRAKSYGGGHINDTFLVETEQGALFLLQRINTRVFRRPEEVMENIRMVSAHLARALVQEGKDPARGCLTLVPLAHGGLLYSGEEGVFRCYRFIAGTVCRERAQTPEQLWEAGFAFGRFGSQLAEFPADTLFETIPRFHDTPNRFQNLAAAAEQDKVGRRFSCEEEIAFCMARKEDCGMITTRLLSGELPLRVTHNDTKLSNILLEESTGRAVCVVDLDTVMPGSALYDFGEGVRSGAATCDEDEADLTKAHFSKDAFLAYTKGFVAGFGDRLTKGEASMLAWGPRMMALENGFRFLTDYLEGDTYYKTDRPSQNLDRARVALRLVDEMEQNFEELSKLAYTAWEEARM